MRWKKTAKSLKVPFWGCVSIMAFFVSWGVGGKHNKEGKTMAENTAPNANEPEETQEEGKTTEKEERTEAENLFHKFYLFGLGLQKDVEETVKNLIERGEMEAGEKEKIVDDFVKKAKESSSTFEEKIEDFVNNALESMNLVTKEKYDALEMRVQELENTIQKLENTIKELHPE
jgi:polyhydroxyalkanoate synthesis regulator phasin